MGKNSDKIWKKWWKKMWVKYEKNGGKKINSSFLVEKINYTQSFKKILQNFLHIILLLKRMSFTCFTHIL